MGEGCVHTPPERVATILRRRYNRIQMKKISWIFILLLTFIFGCNSGDNEKEPEVERVIPPPFENPIESGENPNPEIDLESLRAAAEKTPADVSAIFSYMVGLKSAGKIDDAIEQAKRLGAIEKENPYRAVAYLNLAEMILKKIESGAGNQDELIAEGIKGIEIAIEEEPSNVPARLAYGKLLRESGRVDEAIHQFSIVLAANEVGYEIRVWIAENYIEKGEKEKAKSHLEVALQLAEKDGNTELVKKIKGLLGKV